MHEGTVRKYFRTTFESTTNVVHVLSSTKVKKDIFVRTFESSTRYVYYFQYVYFRTTTRTCISRNILLSYFLRRYFRTKVLYYISTYSTRLPSKVRKYFRTYNARYIQYVVSSNVSHKLFMAVRVVVGHNNTLLIYLFLEVSLLSCFRTSVSNYLSYYFRPYNYNVRKYVDIYLHR